jgi:hypothetical protein
MYFCQEIARTNASAMITAHPGVGLQPSGIDRLPQGTSAPISAASHREPGDLLEVALKLDAARGLIAGMNSG